MREINDMMLCGNKEQDAKFNEIKIKNTLDEGEITYMKEMVMTKVKKAIEDNKNKDLELKIIKEEIRVLKIQNERLKDEGSKGSKEDIEYWM